MIGTTAMGMQSALPDGRRGITLLETVVVAAALVVLASSLIPGTHGVRVDNKQGVCLNNLRQVGYANAVHASQDSAEPALPVHPAFYQQDPQNQIYVGAYEWGGKSGIGEPGFLPTEPAPAGSRYGTRAGFGPARRPVNRILYPQDFPDFTDGPVSGQIADTQLNLDVYRCPSDSGYTGIHKVPFRLGGLTSYNHYGTSYAANLFMIGTQGGGEIFSNSPFLHRLSRIVAPASTIAYQENNGRFAWTSREVEECMFIGQGIPGTVGGWHGKEWTFGASFIDGHADMIYMRSYTNPNIVHYPPQDDASQDEIAAAYRCLIIRGDGWRKDTLPLPFGYTGLFPSEPNGRPSYEDGLE